ncbi:MAG: hypothetical protein AB7E60_05040 [Sphingobium sp.]
MQEFFIDYGLWLLAGLLVVIALIFLLSGRRASADAAPDEVGSHQTGSLQEAPSARVVEPMSAAHQPPAVDMPSDPLALVEPETPLETPAAPPTAPVPSSPAVTAPAATAETADDLLKLKGVGPKLNVLLIELGVTRYAQIAAWSDADIAAIDSRLGAFRGRPVRDKWVDQARYLAAGDIAGYEAVYGKL